MALSRIENDQVGKNVYARFGKNIGLMQMSKDYLRQPKSKRGDGRLGSRWRRYARSLLCDPDFL